MAKIIAVTEAIKSLAEAEARFNLTRNELEARRSRPQYGLSRAFSIYTVPSELRSAFQVLKHLGQTIINI